MRIAVGPSLVSFTLPLGSQPASALRDVFTEQEALTRSLSSAAEQRTALPYLAMLLKRLPAAALQAVGVAGVEALYGTNGVYALQG
jgi:hypothetical protein